MILNIIIIFGIEREDLAGLKSCLALSACVSAGQMARTCAETTAAAPGAGRAGAHFADERFLLLLLISRTPSHIEASVRGRAACHGALVRIPCECLLVYLTPYYRLVFACERRREGHKRLRHERELES